MIGTYADRFGNEMHYNKMDFQAEQLKCYSEIEKSLNTSTGGDYGIQAHVKLKAVRFQARM